jgi:aryl-alcohol dehydrogenase-like predicted oxidoreductase
MRRLGHKGAEIFPIGIGAMSFTNFYGETNQDASFAILRMAMDKGVNHLDTADIYGMGQSEEVIGAFLAETGASARQFFRIATKAGIDRKKTGDGSDYNNDPAYLRASLIASLERLGVDQVDLFYVHRRQSDIPIEDVAGAMAELVKEGLTASIGFSEIAPTSLRRAHAVHPVAAVQSEYSLQTRGPELGLVSATRDIGAAMVAFSPVGRSLLTDHPHNADRVAHMPFLAINPRFIGDNLTRNIAATEPFRQLARDLGMAASTLATAWVLSRDDHVIPIPGTRSVDHFAELIAAAEVQLSIEDLARIDEILPAGWCHGDRYAESQWNAVERFC